jgi:hypothetical protein
MERKASMASNDHSDPAESVHFDLGVDELASGSEIDQMHDPWSPGPSPEAALHSQVPMQMPERDLTPWADSLQLPGM